MSVKQALAENLYSLRKKSGISQTNLCRHLGFALTTVVDIENQRINANQDQLCALADYFGVTVDYLLGREVETSQKPGLSKMLVRRLNKMKSLNEDQVRACLIVLDILLQSYGVQDDGEKE